MITQSLGLPHLLGIYELDAVEIGYILDAASEFKKILHRPIKKIPSLRDKTIANLFFENSTRTRISFELAEKRLSADVINFSASTSSVKKGETLLDTVRNILAMRVDMIVIRHPHPGAPHFLARHIPANVINAGDGTHEHPTQALLDAYSLRDHFGQLKGLRVGILGDVRHSRVALSNIFCLLKMGAEVAVCGPPSLIPYHIESLGARRIKTVDELVEWADAVNVLRIQLERQKENYLPSLEEYHRFYGLKRDHIERRTDPLVVLHPGPMNRGVEIESEVADAAHSLILDQVENGVAIRMAVLFLLAQQSPVR